MTIRYFTRDTALNAVSVAGYNIGYVARDLLDDKEIAKAAILNHAQIYPLSYRLQNDPEMLLLYARNYPHPDIDPDRVMYNILLDPTLYSSDYSSRYNKKRLFNVQARLIYPQLVTCFDEYNSMSPAELLDETMRLMQNEIAALRVGYREQLENNSLSIPGYDSFPQISQLVHCRAVNEPFSSIRSLITRAIDKQEQEKEGYLTFSKGGSFPEKFVASLLRILNIEYVREMRFSWSDGDGIKSGGKRYDFYIPGINTIIEVHGAQHYQGGFEFCGGRSLEEEQSNDSYKERIALENGIAHYIVINAVSSDPDYLSRSIKNNSSFTHLFDVSHVDWKAVRQGTVSNVDNTSFPLHDLKIYHLEQWLKAIDIILTDSDSFPPPDYKDITDGKPYTEDLERNIAKAIPSKNGLYPHEILLLSDAVNLYSVSQTEFPGKWFYMYGIADVPYYLNRLIIRGFMCIGSTRKTLEMQRAVDLKALLADSKMTTAGRKIDLVNRILENIPESIIRNIFPEQYYALTPKGEEELQENEYLFHSNETMTIWGLNRLHSRKKNKKDLPKKSPKWPRKPYSRNRWITAATTAKKEKDYIKEIEIYIDICNHDLCPFDMFEKHFVLENLARFLSYPSPFIKVCPAFIKEIHLAAKRADIGSDVLAETIVSVIKDHPFDGALMSEDEAVAIIAAELENNPMKAAELYKSVYNRISNN